LKPRPIRRSAKITLSFWPQWRYTASITSEMLFLVSSRLIRLNGQLRVRRQQRAHQHAARGW
jgi:hypothetical protein